MTLDTAAIARRVEVATPGPWEASTYPAMGYDADVVQVNGDNEIGDIWVSDDADFIAHARTDVPALLARVAELEADLAALRATPEDAS